MLHVMRDLDGIDFLFAENLHAGLPKIGIPNDTIPLPVTEWEFYKGEGWGWTTPFFLDVCHQLADAGHLFVGEPEPGSVEAWQRIADAGHRIHVKTDRSFGGVDGQPSRNATLRYLVDGGSPFHSVLFTPDKTQGQRCDVGIEDKLENYDALDAAGVEVYLIERPWNHVPGGDDRRRVDTLHEFADLVLEKGAA